MANTVKVGALVLIVGILQVFAGLTAAGAADDPPPSPYDYWKTNWPDYPELANIKDVLKLGSITNVILSNNGVLDCTVTFTSTGGLVRAFNPYRSGDLNYYIANYTKLTTVNLTNYVNIIDLSVNSGTGKQSLKSAQIRSFSPPYLSETTANYHLEIQSDTTIATGNQTNISVSLKLATVFGEAYEAYCDASEKWCTNRLGRLQTVTNAAQLELDYYLGSMQPMTLQSGGLVNLLRLIRANLATSLSITNDPELNADPIVTAWRNQNLISNVSTAYFVTGTNFMAALAAETSPSSLTILQSNLSSTNEQTRLRANNLKQLLFWSLMDSSFCFSVIPKREYINDEPSDALVSLVLNSTNTAAEIFAGGSIIGFTNLVEEVEQLPPADVKADLGAGMADNFIVARVTFQNRTTNNLLLYGNSIIYSNLVSGYTWNDPASKKFLEECKADEDIQINSDHTWTAKTGVLLTRNWLYGHCYEGRVVTSGDGFPSHPVQLSLVSGAWDLRNFNTTQSRCYRFLDTLANVGSSVVPIVNNNNYRDVASIFAGVADPSIKKYFGDMTDSQQQIFLRESMPELLELKVGEEASKLVYFSRYGVDKKEGDQVLFIRQLGAAYKFSITAAIIVNSK